MDKASFSSAPEPFTVYCYLVSLLQYTAVGLV